MAGRAGGLAPAQGQQPLRSLALLLLLALEQGAAQGQLQWRRRQGWLKPPRWS